jgi:homoserine kinase
LRICVPATSANLGPGFDSLGLAIKLRNCVDIKPSKSYSISIKGEGANNIKMKTDNLFVNIFHENYMKITNATEKREKFRFSFFNNIPISRGLGSSSAVIISALASACESAGVTSVKSRILNMALNYESHPDNITPAVMGGFNASVVDRGKVYNQKKDIPPYLKALVVIPNKPISTNQSRTVLPKFFSMEKAVFNLSHSSLLTSAFFSENWELLKIASRDKFHQRQRMKAFPELFNIQKVALDYGALMSTLSGSGSTFFNLMYTEDVIPLKKKLEQMYPQFKIKVYDFDNDGLQIYK